MGAVDHPLVVLDIDGTVCQNGHRIDWSNAQSVARLCQPIKLAQARVAVMYAGGWAPAFLSARHRTMMSVTHRHVADWFGSEVAQEADIELWDEFGADFGDSVLMHNAIATWKADALRDFADTHRRWCKARGIEPGIGTFVGDSRSDEKAAELAGWRFMWAGDWRAGQPFVRDGESLRAESPEEICTVPEGESRRPLGTEVDSAHPEASA